MRVEEESKTLGSIYEAHSRQPEREPPGKERSAFQRRCNQPFRWALCGVSFIHKEEKKSRSFDGLVQPIVALRLRALRPRRALDPRRAPLKATLGVRPFFEHGVARKLLGDAA